MINSLYPWCWIYYDMAEGEEDPGGGEGGSEGGSDVGNGGGDSDVGNGVEYPADILAAQEDVQIVPLEIDVSTIPGNKYITSFTMSSYLGKQLIGGPTESSISSGGAAITAYIMGSPGAKFYLNIVDIDDDEVFDLSNVYIPVSGKYTAIITFPASNAVNKYKINLRPGDGTIINTSLPTTDPMWTIHQYTKPTITFTKTTGTATGVTYTGDDSTLTANSRARMGRQTNPFQSTSLNNGTSVSSFGTLNYAVTAAKSGALVYIKTTNFVFANDTTVVKTVNEDVVNSDIVKLKNVDNLSIGMVATLDTYTKTKLYNIDSLILKLSDTSNLLPGMAVSGDGGSAIIVSIINDSEIIISNDIAARDKANLTFYRTTGGNITIKSIDTDLKEVTLRNQIDKINVGTSLSFKNDEMRFVGSIVKSNSGSASTTLTNTITLQSFGTKDVTFTLPTDDIFTLTPNAFDQNVNAFKETAKDINVLLLDTDDNSGSKTPSTVRNPSHGAISGSYGSGDGTITYTPAIGFIGEDSFTFKVNDGTTDSETKTVYITVKK